ncbi:insulinase family protein [Elizabethkingia anophelis]|uniref:insulinase family protein n=1 Tax=Elizabethkingia anophelis TaxID=1117645 RepID=UPI0038929EBF
MERNKILAMKKMLFSITVFISALYFSQQIKFEEYDLPNGLHVIIARPKIFQLNNGLTVMVVEDNKLPKVNANLLIQMSPYYEGALTGRRDVIAEQFNKGTTNSSKEEFNKKIDFLGASLSFSSSGASAGSLPKYFPEVLDLMADAIINPKFSKEVIQNSKNRMLENLKSEEKDTSVTLARVSNALQYGKNTSKGQFVTAESVNKIQLTDVHDLYEKYYTPDQTRIFVVGKASDISAGLKKLGYPVKYFDKEANPG